MRRYFPFALVLSVLFGCNTNTTINPKKKETSVLFTTKIADDATPAVLSRILDVANHPITEIKFEKGTYHFHPEKAKEFFVFLSNHNDQVTRTAFPIEGFNGITIDGQGSTFVFHGKMIPFLIDNSKNVKVKNLSVDWEVPFHSEGIVVANNLDKGTFDLKFSKDYPYEIRNEQLYFIKPYYEHTIGQAILYDPERNAIAYDTESYTPLTSFSQDAVQYHSNDLLYKYGADPQSPEQKKLGRQNKLRVKELEPGLVRVYNHSKKLPKVGLVFVCKGDQWKNRLSPAFRVTHTYGFDAEDVTVHHAGGMGLIAENSADLTLNNFNVKPSRGRMVSTTADATHFVGCRGKVTLKNCTFNNQLDDASNIHGTYQIVVDVLDDYAIGVRMGHFQQQGFSIGIPKDSIGFVRLNESFFPFGTRTIKSIDKRNGRYQIITFNEKLPSDLKVGDLVENLNGYPEVLIENCNISKNRARGLLLSTPKKTVIKNNFFSTEMEALLMPVESSFWYESGSIKDLTVVGNTFQDCNHSGYDRGIIRFETDDDNENIAFKNITIANNTINHFDKLFMEIANTDGLIFKENEINASDTFPELFPKNPAIHIRSSKNILFKDNSYLGNAEIILETEGDMEKIQFN